jgi:hypothetical protein
MRSRAITIRNLRSAAVTRATIEVIKHFYMALP